MLNIIRTLKSSNLSKALYSSQVAHSTDTSEDSKQAPKFLNIQERSQKVLQKDRSGFNNPELDRIIEAGPHNEQRTKLFKSLSKVHKKDHPEIRSIKNKIKELLHRELEEQHLLEKISKAE